jgi:hypothetical protein
MFCHLHKILLVIWIGFIRILHQHEHEEEKGTGDYLEFGEISEGIGSCLKTLGATGKPEG